jgi:zinc and cadmium transporter
VSAIALVGIVFTVSRRFTSDRSEMLLLSFAAGVLLATVFLELLPEGVARADGNGNVFLATLAAMIGFFFLERFLHGFHVHEDSRAVASRTLVLIGDGAHNFIDGIVIAASFLASPSLGIATTVAVCAHEIPQEIADYAILVRGKLTPRRALLLNFLSGLTSLLGVLVCFWLEDLVVAHLSWFLTATAGMFIYIAASDLIPELHHPRYRGQWIYSAPFLLGIALMGILSRVVGTRH